MYADAADVAPGQHGASYWCLEVQLPQATRSRTPPQQEGVWDTNCKWTGSLPSSRGGCQQHKLWGLALSSFLHCGVRSGAAWGLLKPEGEKPGSVPGSGVLPGV